MILQNFRENLRNANWSAVIIELLVVVVGVYGAFQLERMGEEWRESKQEKIYLVQLRDELSTTLERVRERLHSDREELKFVDETLQLLMQPVGSGELTDALCGAIFEISILPWTPVTLVTMEEMINTGFVSGLDDLELKYLLLRLRADMELRNGFMELVRPQQNILMDMYPLLMPRRLDAANEASLSCDADGMRRSQPFINHLMSNRGRHRGMIADSEESEKLLVELHVRLDLVLGNSPPGEESSR